MVATNGVLVLALIEDRNSNSRPSLDIAYRIRGIGNRQPNKLYKEQKRERIRIVNGFIENSNVTSWAGRTQRRPRLCTWLRAVPGFRKWPAKARPRPETMTEYVRIIRRNNDFINPYDSPKAQWQGRGRKDFLRSSTEFSIDSNS